MLPAPHFAWPFFADHHRDLARAVRHWSKQHLASTPFPSPHATDALEAHCRALVRQLGATGWLRWCVPISPSGASDPAARLDTRALCLLRETFAWHSALADFAFALQGLGAGALSLFGDERQKAHYLPDTAEGHRIAAFALSEPQAGSDVAALSCRATRLEHGDWQLDGEKTWISNGGIADYYVVFARSEPATTRSSQGISAFIVDAATPGLKVAERLTTLSPHPLARLEFTACRIPANQQLGSSGQGFKIAMSTLDVFRISVAAAALGLARRAVDEALHHVRQRRLFGQQLADLQLTQGRIADMVTALDAATLLTYRAAWQRDQTATTQLPASDSDELTCSAAMAKLFATEEAQRIIDSAVQLLGARGLQQGEIVESLYRDIRALRIYEGASEIQKLVIARTTLKRPAGL